VTIDNEAADWRYECDYVSDPTPTDVPNGNGGSSGAGNNVIDLPKDPSGIVDWKQVFKTVKAFCLRSNESCSPSWTTRMTLGEAGSTSICRLVGIGLQGVCNAEVGFEASYGCPNVSSC
jgi:hypothetical protein